MASLTESSVTRSLDDSGDEIKTFTDSDGREIQGVAVTDSAGDHAGIATNPISVDAELLSMYLAKISEQLGRIEFQLSILTGFEP